MAMSANYDIVIAGGQAIALWSLLDNLPSPYCDDISTFASKAQRVRRALNYSLQTALSVVADPTQPRNLAHEGWKTMKNPVNRFRYRSTHTTGFPIFRTELNAILDVDHGHKIKSYGLCSDEIPSLFDSSNVGEILKYLQVWISVPNIGTCLKNICKENLRKLFKYSILVQWEEIFQV